MRNLHPASFKKTEYRNRFNQAKPFHKSSVTASTGRLPKKVAVYDRYA